MHFNQAVILQNHIIIKLLLNIVPEDAGEMSEDFKELLKKENKMYEDWLKY